MPSVAVSEKQNENKSWGSFMKNITLGDHIHCCPHGYTCDTEHGKCHKKSEELNNIPCPGLVLIENEKTEDKSIVLSRRTLLS